MEYINLILSALSQGMLYAPMAMGVFIAFKILNTPDLTIDGSLVFGMTVCAVVTIASHPILALVAGTLAGALAGFVTGFLQTKLRINAILAGILTMTGLYTVNYMVLGGQSNLYLQTAETNESGSEVFVSSNTIYKMFSSLFPGLDTNANVLLLTALIVAAVAALLCVFSRRAPAWRSVQPATMRKWCAPPPSTRMLPAFSALFLPTVLSPSPAACCASSSATPI